MRKASSRAVKDDLRPEDDLTKLKKAVRGKYFKQAMAGTNLVLVDPDLAKVFPDSAAVNRALRVLCDAAGKSTQSSRRSIKNSTHRKRSAA
ncbi:MAG: hypothetical protein KF693_16255 [Nitrospira sp.]|nr:hypothetical protein [Nitrospira sp.]